MSRPKARARAARANHQPWLRQLQRALAVATCIRIAADHCEPDQFDVADAVGGLLALLEAAGAMLDRPEGKA
jgi:hypothetical protein